MESKKLSEVEKLLKESNEKNEETSNKLKELKDTQAKKETESLLEEMVREGKTHKHFNDTVLRPHFLSIGIEKALEIAKDSQVLIKLEARGTEKNEVNDNGAELTEGAEVDKKATSLMAKNKDLTYEDAVEEVYSQEGGN